MRFSALMDGDVNNMRDLTYARREVLGVGSLGAGRHDDGEFKALLWRVAPAPVQLRVWTSVPDDLVDLELPHKFVGR